jgi:hypothetical protein
MALDWTAIENALHAWLAASTGLAAANVIWSNQSNPQPARPYVTMKMLDLGHVGRDALTHAYDPTAVPRAELTTTVDGRRELTIAVQVFSASTTGAATARALLTKAQTALSLPGVQSVLSAAGLAILNEGRITDLTELLETRWQSRASVDVQFNCVDSAQETTGFIESVDLVDDLQT